MNFYLVLAEDECDAALLAVEAAIAERGKDDPITPALQRVVELISEATP